MNFRSSWGNFRLGRAEIRWEIGSKERSVAETLNELRRIDAISAWPVLRGREKPAREMQIAASQTALSVAIVPRRTPRVGGTVAYGSTRDTPSVKLPARKF